MANQHVTLCIFNGIIEIELFNIGVLLDNLIILFWLSCTCMTVPGFSGLSFRSYQIGFKCLKVTAANSDVLFALQVL